MTAGISLIPRKTGAHRSCERIRNEGKLEPQKAQKAQETYVLLVPLWFLPPAFQFIHTFIERRYSDIYRVRMNARRSAFSWFVSLSSRIILKNSIVSSSVSRRPS